MRPIYALIRKPVSTGVQCVQRPPRIHREFRLKLNAVPPLYATVSGGCSCCAKNWRGGISLYFSLVCLFTALIYSHNSGGSACSGGRHGVCLKVRTLCRVGSLMAWPLALMPWANGAKRQRSLPCCEAFRGRHSAQLANPATVGATPSAVAFTIPGSGRWAVPPGGHYSSHPDDRRWAQRNPTGENGLRHYGPGQDQADKPISPAPAAQRLQGT